MSEQPMDNLALEKIRKFAKKKLNKKYCSSFLVESTVSDSCTLIVHVGDGRVLKIEIQEIR